MSATNEAPPAGEPRAFQSEGGANPSVPANSEISLADAANWYAAHGFAVFPLRPRDKIPATPRGFKDATTDAVQVARWWRDSPTANIGIPTGEASGLLVVDCDPRNGGPIDRDDLADLCGPWPETAEAQTGGGGRHVYFRHPGGRFPAKVADGVDLKADGGYVVAPPSVHPSGGAYSFDGTDGARTLLNVADCPAWLLAYRKSERPASRLAGAESELIPEGSRNNSLASIAGALRARGLSPAAIEAALLVENQERCKPPLQADEVRRIATSIGRYQPGPITTRGIDPGAARTPSDALVLVNALPWWRGLQWGAFRRRGDALVGVTTCGHEVRFSMGKILRHTHAQERILADAGVAIASPRKGQVTAQWASVAELMVKAASVDAIDCGRGEDDLRADLARTWHGGGAEARNSREDAAGIAATLRSYRREPHAPNAPACVFTVGPEVWVHLGVFREWLTTPSGGARYRSLPELREAAGLLGLSPRVEDLATADGRRVQLTFWCGPASIVTEGAAD